MKIEFKKSSQKIPVRTRNTYKLKPLWEIEVDGKVEFVARFSEALRVYHNFLSHLEKTGS